MPVALKSLVDKIPDFSKAKFSEINPRDGITSKIPDFSQNDDKFSRFLPENNGKWEGAKGDSVWVPQDVFVPLKHNLEGLTWEKIKEIYKFKHIPFSDGEPDFTEVSKSTVKIIDFSISRNGNFTQADEKCADQWTKENKDGKIWSPEDVKAYRKENCLSWHERSDQNTMDLIPSIIHGNIPHSGGISAAKSGENNEQKNN